MNRPATSFTGRPRGFTLVEIMVVIVIILLMIGLAVPVLHVITGSRSEQGATNNIAAMLGRARADAVGLQKPMGVAFVTNPTTGVCSMAEVAFPDCQPWVATVQYKQGSAVTMTDPANPAINDYYYAIADSAVLNSSIPPVPGQTGLSGGVWPVGGGMWQPVGGPPLDMAVDTDLVPLPAGVSVQTICNATINSSTSARVTDGYVSDGVILFDGKGRLAPKLYGIPVGGRLASAAGFFATQLFPGPAVPTIASPGSPPFGVQSQYGVVVFQREAFQSQKSPNADTFYLPNSQQQSGYTTGTPSQQTEETWLDQNSTPLLINRFTGTLVKGE